MTILIPMCRRADEIEAAVDSRVHDVSSVQSTFIFQILLELRIDVLHYRLKAVTNINVQFD